MAVYWEAVIIGWERAYDMKKLFLVLAACLCNHVTASAAPTLNDPALTVSEVVSGLSFPTTMAFIGPDDILVLQKATARCYAWSGGSYNRVRY